MACGTVPVSAQVQDVSDPTSWPLGHLELIMDDCLNAFPGGVQIISDVICGYHSVYHDYIRDFASRLFSGDSDWSSRPGVFLQEISTPSKLSCPLFFTVAYEGSGSPRVDTIFSWTCLDVKPLRLRFLTTAR